MIEGVEGGKLRFNYSTVSLLVFVFLCVNVQATFQLVPNGSFETGDFTNWTIVQQDATVEYDFSNRTIDVTADNGIILPTDGLLSLNVFAETGNGTVRRLAIENWILLPEDTNVCLDYASETGWGRIKLIVGSNFSYALGINANNHADGILCVLASADNVNVHIEIGEMCGGTGCPFEPDFNGYIDNIRFEVTPINRLNILEPKSNQQIEQRTEFPIKFEVRNDNYDYLEISEIEYKLKDSDDWIQKQASGYGVYQFYETAPNEEGTHTVSVRTFIDGNWVSDSSNYIVTPKNIDLNINFIKAIQVIEDVDLVAGKATAVKVGVNNYNNANTPLDVNVRIEFNDKNYDLVENFYGDYNFIFYVNNPYEQEGEYTITAEIDADKRYEEIDENNTREQQVTVKKVKELDIVFRPIDFVKDNHYIYTVKGSGSSRNYYITNTYVYENDIKRMTNFLKASYPLVKINVDPDNEVYCLDNNCLKDINYQNDKDKILHSLGMDYLLSKYISIFSGKHFKVVGITPAGTVDGYAASGDPWINFAAALVDYPNTSVISHEIGHLVWYNNDRLCDEYWDNSDENRCANPSPPDCNCLFLDENGTLGCYGSIVNNGIWVENREEFSSVDSDVCNVNNTFSFMGTSEYRPPRRWTTYTEYQHIFSSFEDGLMQKSGGSDINILLVSGLVDIDLNVELDRFFVIEGQEFGSSDGNCLVRTTDVNGLKLNDYNFALSFRVLSNPPEDSNYSSFILGIQFDGNINSVQVICNGELKAERFVSTNAPTVSIISPSGGEEWSGENLVEWTANDSDGDDLEFVVQYSDDSGSTWNPLGMHVTDTNFTFDVGMVDGNTSYKIKIIATDGILTAEDISATFSILNPDINVVPSEWDLGTINDLQNVLQDFNIINSGNADLNVFDVNYSDDLNVTNLSLPIVLEPGEGHVFSVELQVLDMNLGEFIKDINLGSNDPNDIVKRIKIYGEIEEAKPDFRITADNITFNPVYPEEDQNVTISALIENLGDLNASDVNVTFYEYYKEYGVDENTVGLYHLNDSSGTIVSDSSDNEYEFNFDEGNPPQWDSTIKIFGSHSLKFSDSFDFIETEDNSDWDLIGDATWEFWIYPTSLEGYILHKTRYGVAQGWSITVNGEGKISFAQYGVSSGVNMISNSSIEAEEWTHIAIVRDASELQTKIYFNGELDKNQSYTGTPNTNDYGARVGTHGGEYGFIGNIDEIRVSNMARTNFDINLNLIDNKNISFIDANSSELVSVDWNNIQARDPEVFVRIDDENVIDEKNELNNQDSNSITVYSNPILSVNFDFNGPNDLGEPFDLNVILENIGAKLLDANVELILPEELSTTDSLIKTIGDLNSHTSIGIEWTDINSSQAGLFEIIVNVKGTNADENFSTFTSIRHMELSDLNVIQTLYPNDTNIADFNITNYSLDISYAGYYYRTEIFGPENYSEDKNIGVLHTGETKQETAQISAWKEAGDYNLTVSLYDASDELVDQKEGSFEVVPYEPSALSYYSTDGLTFDQEFTSYADYFSSASDENQQVMIVYAYNGDLNYSIRNPFLQEWNSPSTIGSGDYPYLVGDGNDFHLVYVDENVYYRKYSSGVWNSAELVSVMLSVDPLLTFDGSDLYALFSSEVDGLFNVFLAGFNGSWNTEIELTHCLDANCSNPIVLDEGLVDGKLSYAYRKFKGEEYSTLDSNLMYSLFDVNYFYWGS